MKAVILAGGFGTRLAEETSVKPKPMVEIGDKPILWHIMKLYSSYGFDDFVICLGYKGYLIKEYFSNYALHNSDVTFDMRTGEMVVHQSTTEPWRITLVDTGAESMTGGRIKRIQPFIGDETFMLTYGDGLSDVDVSKVVEFHREHGKYATVTAVQPLGRFGAMNVENECEVRAFQEKPQGDGGWVNGGFFVLEPAVFDYIEGDSSIWEREPLEGLASDCQLMAYRHRGFWMPMDTLGDKNTLDALWSAGEAPWKKW